MGHDECGCLEYNIRSLNKEVKWREILRVIQKHSIGLLGLLETRVRADNSAYIRNRLVPGWDALF